MKPHLLRLLCLALLLPAAGNVTRGQDTSPQVVYDVDITLSLTQKGSVLVQEDWDVDTGTGITEWYLVRENLGDIELTQLYVSDEKATDYENIGDWNVKATLSQKKDKCGVVRKEDGAELCWGIGSYGRHRFHVIYGMVGAVKSLDDYDLLHLQVVSPGLSSPPRHVKVTVCSDAFQLDTLNTRLWGFGFQGNAAVEDGVAVYESDGPLGTENSVIVLLRFEKGLMTPQSIRHQSFQEVLDFALIGSDYLENYQEEKKEDKTAEGIAGFFTLLVMYLLARPFLRELRGKKSKRELKQVLGRESIGWYRDIPMDGNLDAAHIILEDLGENRRKNLPAAEILRMIYLGNLKVTRDLEGPVKISFTDKGIDRLPPSCQKLYKMMKKAAGKNNILEDKEFSQWIKDNGDRAYDWADEVDNCGRAYLRQHNLYDRYYTPEGQKQARNLVGLNHFLSEFTLSREREAIEVNLWKEYLVYATLFGVAERVARQMKDIDPALFKETFRDDDTFAGTCTMLGSFSEAVRRGVVIGMPYSSSSSGYSSGGGGSSHSRSSGGGGRTSSGGGHGYSGGGRGGGGR